MRAVLRMRVLGFSPAELFVVGIILSIIGASAVPRFSRGADSLADSALAGNLAVLRNGIEVYAGDHGGTFPAVATFDAQMTQYTDEAGNASPHQDSRYRFGPYLRRVPLLTVGPVGFKGSAEVLDSARTVGATAGAWVYDPKSGEIRANLGDSAVDYTGKRYNQY